LIIRPIFYAFFEYANASLFFEFVMLKIAVAAISLSTVPQWKIFEKPQTTENKDLFAGNHLKLWKVPKCEVRLRSV
jgi:hypothetical protein